jgi:hypothetical protein
MAPMIRVPSLPSVEAFACTSCGMRYERGSWAEDIWDEGEEYKRHVEKIKRLYSKKKAPKAPLPSQRLRCGPGSRFT